MITRAITNELGAKVGRQLRTAIFRPEDARRMAVLATQHQAIAGQQVDR